MQGKPWVPNLFRCESGTEQWNNHVCAKPIFSDGQYALNLPTESVHDTLCSDLISAWARHPLPLTGTQIFRYKRRKKWETSVIRWRDQAFKEQQPTMSALQQRISVRFWDKRPYSIERDLSCTPLYYRFRTQARNSRPSRSSQPPSSPPP
jgi:hypothetical protein